MNRPDSHAAFREAADRVLDRSDPGAFNQAVMELGGSDPFIVLADAVLDKCCLAAESEMKDFAQSLYSVNKHFLPAAAAPAPNATLAYKTR